VTRKEEEIIVYLNFLMEIQIYKIRSELGQLKLTIGDKMGILPHLKFTKNPPPLVEVGVLKTR